MPCLSHGRAQPPRHDLAGETVLITAGGTREALDPVRYFGNRSSGKMGYALAEAAVGPRGKGHPDHCASTALTPPRAWSSFRSPLRRRCAMPCWAASRDATIVIKAAAVSDYRPEAPCRAEDQARGALHLSLSRRKTSWRRSPPAAAGTLVVGFAAETEHAWGTGVTSCCARAPTPWC